MGPRTDWRGFLTSTSVIFTMKLRAYRAYDSTNIVTIVSHSLLALVPMPNLFRVPLSCQRASCAIIMSASKMVSARETGQNTRSNEMVDFKILSRSTSWKMVTILVTLSTTSANSGSVDCRGPEYVPMEVKYMRHGKAIIRYFPS